MPNTGTLFPEHLAATGQNTAVTALQMNGSALSPVQKRFNQLLAQTETLARKIEAFTLLSDQYRKDYASTLTPLENEKQDLMQQMVLWLDERLQRRGLTNTQKVTATDILCDLSSYLAIKGDQAMRTLHDAYSDKSLVDIYKEETADLQSFMEAMMGQKLDVQAESPEDLLRAGMAQFVAQAEAEHDQQTQRQAKRKKTAAQLKSEVQEQDANSALRTIYRQLASALHPDRETDPQEQLRKTALMKEANTAYEQRNLLALLHLQLKADLVDQNQIANMAQDKLTALTALLKDRVAVLQTDLNMLQSKICMEFELPPYLTPSAASLKKYLAKSERKLRNTITTMRSDLQGVKDDAWFKRWLRDQRASFQPDDNPFF